MQAVALIAAMTFSCANAQEPPPTVAVIINGIGFDYVPAIAGLECVRGACVLSERSGGVLRELRFSSSFNVNRGCPKPLPSLRVSKESLTVTYRCAEETITERFTKNGNPREDDGAFIRAASGQWRPCHLTSGSSYACAATVRSVLPRQQWLEDDTIDKWLPVRP